MSITTPTMVFMSGRVVAGTIGAYAILTPLSESETPLTPKGESR